MKQCTNCNIIKDEMHFYKARSECKECSKDRQRRRRAVGIPTKRHQHVCSLCGRESWLTKDKINRKVFKSLCNSCAQKKKRNTGGLNSQPKDWAEIYSDPQQTGETLDNARTLNLKYYKRDCPVHGPMPYAVLDQTCRLCTRESAKRRNKENPEFNRPRTIVGAAKRRAKLKNIEFNLTVDDIRTNIPSECPVLKLPLTYDTDTDTSPSLDRLNPACGYTKENVRIISNRANRIKSDGTPQEHIKIAIWQLKENGVAKDDILDILIRTVEGAE